MKDTNVTTTSTTIHPVAAKLNALAAEINSVFLERENVTLVMLLALLTKQHSYVLGPPGTAKSDHTRALMHAITGARSFETALSKTRPPEKVLGPLDMLTYRETGEYLLKRRGYLTDVELAFVDEVGKMSPVLGHDLLALANERKIHEVRDGVSVHDAPLYSMFTASNEMITDESDDASAFWDRLLWRTTVDYLQNRDNFRALLVSTMKHPTTTIEWSELKDVIDNVIPNIPMHETAVEAMLTLHDSFARESLYPSDRRWRAVVRGLQANAFLDGREFVEEDDLVVLQYALWDTVEQIDKVQRLCLAAANPFTEPVLDLKAAIKEIDANISERVGPDAAGNPQDENRQAYGKEAVRKLKEVRTNLDTILMEAAGRRIPIFRQVVDLHDTVLHRAFTVCLEQPEAVTQTMMKENDRLGQGYGDQ